MQTVAQGLLVLKLTGSGTQLGLINLVRDALEALHPLRCLPRAVIILRLRLIAAVISVVPGRRGLRIPVIHNHPEHGSAVVREPLANRQPSIS